eukprot:1053056-Rhodomonas_salina.1
MCAQSCRRRPPAASPPPLRGRSGQQSRMESTCFSADATSQIGTEREGKREEAGVHATSALPRTAVSCMSTLFPTCRHTATRFACYLNSLRRCPLAVQSPLHTEGMVLPTVVSGLGSRASGAERRWSTLPGSCSYHHTCIRSGGRTRAYQL